MPGMHTNGPDYTTRDIRRAIHEWIKGDTQLVIKMHITPEMVEALVRRIRPICKQPQ